MQARLYSLMIGIGSLITCGQAVAINKCTIDGKVVFQDAPCTTGRGETLIVKPSRGRSEQPSSAPAAAGGGATADGERPLSEAQRIEKQVAESQRARRRQEYEVRIVPDAALAVNQQRARCDDELAALRGKKRFANNNLAGATWEGSISGEMTALATRCDTQNRELRDELERRRAECRALGGCL